jgi:methylenetetrahydrofolate--tRNA-(uracil-5-)-methyltransferase
MKGLQEPGESAKDIMGLLAGRNAVRLRRGDTPLTPPVTTMMGALTHYITHADPKHFQPMNSNWGIMPQPEQKISDKRQKHEWQAEQAMTAMAGMVEQFNGQAALA